MREAVVLCRGLLRRMDLAGAGRRARLGSVYGFMNHENLNGSANALLAAQQFNSAIPLPFISLRARLPTRSRAIKIAGKTFDEADVSAVYRLSQWNETEFLQERTDSGANEFANENEIVYNSVNSNLDLSAIQTGLHATFWWVVLLTIGEQFASHGVFRLLGLLESRGKRMPSMWLHHASSQ